MYINFVILLPFCRICLRLCFFDKRCFVLPISDNRLIPRKISLRGLRCLWQRATVSCLISINTALQSCLILFSKFYFSYIRMYNSNLQSVAKVLGTPDLSRTLQPVTYYSEKKCLYFLETRKIEVPLPPSLLRSRFFGPSRNAPCVAWRPKKRLRRRLPPPPPPPKKMLQ